MSAWLMLLIGTAIAGVWYSYLRFRVEPLPGFARTESDNSAEAMYQQGMAYRRGQDLELDFQAARRLLHRAAKLHHAQAQYEYGTMLDRGLGGEQDQGRGLRWIGQAARSGCTEARFHLGQRYHHGDGVVKDSVRAEEYLRKAAEAGMAGAQTALGLLYRDAAPADHEAAAEWLGRAAGQRFPAAYLPLSELLEWGVGVQRDLKKADEFLRLSAEFGDLDAQLKIAHYYLTGPVGHFFPQDYRVALTWFKRAAAHGVAEAEYEVGVRYEQNEGVDEPDMGRAIASYLKAAEMCYAPAQCRMGQVYLYGQTVNQNLREALRWFEAAAGQQHVVAIDYVKKLQSHVADSPSGHGSSWGDVSAHEADGKE